NTHGRPERSFPRGDRLDRTDLSAVGRADQEAGGCRPVGAGPADAIGPRACRGPGRQPDDGVEGIRPARIAGCPRASPWPFHGGRRASRASHGSRPRGLAATDAGTGGRRVASAGAVRLASAGAVQVRPAGNETHRRGVSMQPSIGSTVTIRNLDLAYSGHSVLKGLDWNLPRGQVVGLLGRNGAGKTSLLEAMLGLRDNATGQINLFDQPVARLDDTARERIGYVPQQSDLFEWLTPAQLLAYFRSFYSHWNEAKVETLLTRWSIDRHLPIGKLSGGQQQRLSIIRAMAHEPDLLILDEPVASLDPAGRRDFLQEIVAQVIDRDTTVVFSTHILSDLERVAFDVAFLSEGKIVL